MLKLLIDENLDQRILRGLHLIVIDVDMLLVVHYCSEADLENQVVFVPSPSFARSLWRRAQCLLTLRFHRG